MLQPVVCLYLLPWCKYKYIFILNIKKGQKEPKNGGNYLFSASAGEFFSGKYKIITIYFVVQKNVRIFAKSIESMKVTNITDFRSNAKQYIDSVIRDHSALVINRGKTAAVLISLDEYNSIVETERIMSSRHYEGLKESVEQFYNNELVTVDIDDL